MTGDELGPDAIDRRAVRRAFSRAAATYDAVAVLQREVGRRMDERLDVVKLAPEAILDAGCGTGEALAALAARYPSARRVGLDIALPMLAAARARTVGTASPLARVSALWRKRSALPGFVAADIAALPFAGASFDLVWSNLALQWAHELATAVAEFHRVLKVGGLAMFTTFGPDTLQELRVAFREVDGRPHVSRFADMHDIGDMLVHAGFADPVMHMERITMTYAEPMALLRDLKALGATNAALGRARGLFGRAAWARVLASVEATRRDGRIPATFEVVYGHAWKAAPRRVADGRAIVHFEPRR